jgi:hypothetical protein
LTFDWADVDMLTAHLLQLHHDRELVRSMGSASRLRAAQFSWNAAAQQYGAVFEKLARRRDYPSLPPAASLLTPDDVAAIEHTGAH